MTRPLDGMRVVDFTWVLAGPHCVKSWPTSGELGMSEEDIKTLEVGGILSSDLVR